MRPDTTIEHLRSHLTMHVAVTIDRLNQWNKAMTNGGVHVPSRRIIDRDIERALWLIDFCTTITTDAERRTMRSDLREASIPVLILLRERTAQRSAQRKSKSANAL